MYDIIIGTIYGLLQWFVEALNITLGTSLSLTLQNDTALILLFLVYLFVIYWFIRLTVAVIRWFYRI